MRVQLVRALVPVKARCAQSRAPEQRAEQPKLGEAEHDAEDGAEGGVAGRPHALRAPYDGTSGAGAEAPAGAREGGVCSVGNADAQRVSSQVQHRVSWIFWGVAHQFHTASRVTRLLKLTNGDSALMMAWFGLAGSCNNTLSVVISPLVGSLSDAVGRKYLVAAGRMGTGLFFLSTIMAKTMRQQFVINVVSWGVLMSGNIPAQQAMFDDLFGTRPKLASLVNNANEPYQYFCSTIAPLAGAWTAANMEWLGHWLPFALMAATSVLWATGEETLTADKKKPFSLAKANALHSTLGECSNGRLGL